MRVRVTAALAWGLPVVWLTTTPLIWAAAGRAARRRSIEEAPAPSARRQADPKWAPQPIVRTALYMRHCLSALAEELQLALELRAAVQAFEGRCLHDRLGRGR